MKLVIASNNRHKITEIKSILGSRFGEIFSLGDLHIDVEVEETGATFADNALIKAEAISKLTGMVAIADDSGLMVEALGGEPGVYSARYAGEPCSDSANNAKLLKELERVGATDYDERKAKFVSSIVMYFPDGKVVESSGEVQGHILGEYHGDGGFGYDPLFYCDELGKTFGEASSAEKNLISHRYRALTKIADKL